MSGDGERATGIPGVYWPKDRTVETADGALIDYTFLGPSDGPVVALASGFMCPDTWWYYLAPALAACGHRVLLVHYRGVASSSLPDRLDGPAFTMERHAQDLVDVLDAEGIRVTSLLGHSMGVQVMLEAYRVLRDRVRCMVAVTGQFSSPIRTLYDGRAFSYAVWEPVRLAVRAMPGPLRQAAWRAALRLPAFKVGQLIRAFGPRTDERIVASYLEHLATRDIDVVLRVAEGMHAHSAADLLPQVAVPTLVVIGGRDPFSPPSQGQLMASSIAGSIAKTVPMGMHGTILEYPEQVNGYVLDFLAEHAPPTNATYSAPASAGSKSMTE